MVNPYAIWTIARYEARLLWRSWAFRLFSALGLLFLFFLNFIIISPLSNAPQLLRAVSGHLPLLNLKLFNLYQGVIAAFLATEFIRRDRRQDTAQTLFVHSYTNLDYILGKFLGIALLFVGLQALILTAVALGHRFFAAAPFAWQPYLLFPLFTTLPTLVFTVGLTWLSITLLRNQALVLVFILGLSFFCFVLGQRFYYTLDLFAFFLPLEYSDFVGLTNLDQLLQIRATHLLCGLAGIGLTALLLGRLRQSRLAALLALSIALAGAGGAVWTSRTYVQQQKGIYRYREELRTLSRAATGIPVPTLAACRLELEPRGTGLSATARLTLVNPHPQPLDSLLFTLNPGLEITGATIAGRTVPHRREEHLLWLYPQTPLAARDSGIVDLTYRGSIDPRFCYLDIDDERFDAFYGIWLYRSPKRYAFLQPEFVHLTAESGWYPVSGLPPGATFPRALERSYTRYRLAASLPHGWTAFSQGEATVDSSGPSLQYSFRPDQPLPQISFTAGPYEARRLEVDGITYTLAHLPGHDQFSTYFDSIRAVLPATIRELRNGYEAALGLEYPYPRLSLVEVPIQFYAYRRTWTLAQESVQPEILFLPEMGILCEGTDFKRMKRQATRSQERANQAESAEQLQADYLRTFARLDLFGTQDPGMTDVSQNRSLEARWYLLPQYLSYATHIASARWPVLNYAFEAYFRERIAPPANTWNRQWRGLTESERASLELQKHPLADLLIPSAETGQVDSQIRETAIHAKGRQLLLLLAARVGLARFDRALTEFAAANRRRPIDDEKLLAFLAQLTGEDPQSLLDSWYRTTDLPGYRIEKAEAYLVRHGERTRTQVEIDLGNPTDVDGLVKLNLRYRQDEFTSWWERQRAGWDFARVVPLPAHTRKQVGILLDRQPAELIVDTYVARNIPSLIYFGFGEQSLRKSARPFSGERSEPLQPADPDSVGWIVDDEDEGFAPIAVEGTSRLRRFLFDLFDMKEHREPYVGLRSWEPPGTWQATTDHRLYGRFVRSAYYKEAGDGRSRVSWQARLDAAGDYEISFYCGLREELRRRRRGNDRDQTCMRFTVHHEDGVEERGLNLQELEVGWNYLGTYRLAAGPARIELSDRSSARFVVADAVRWMRR